MATPTVGTITNNNNGDSATSGQTFDSTIDAGSDIAIVFIGLGDGLADTTHDTVTLGGDSMTKLDEHGDTNEVLGCSVWYKTSPQTGTVEVVASWQNVERAAICVLPFTGVDTGTPFGAVTKAMSTRGTAVTADAAGDTDDLMLNFLVHRDGTDTTASFAANQTERGNAAGGTNIAAPHSYLATEPFNTTASSPVTLAATLDNSEAWVQIVVALKNGAGGAANANTSRSYPRGVGRGIRNGVTHAMKKVNDLFVPDRRLIIPVGATLS